MSKLSTTSARSPWAPPAGPRAFISNATPPCSFPTLKSCGWRSSSARHGRGSRQVTITDGILNPDDNLTITIELGDGAILFGDGIENDRIHVDWGQTSTSASLTNPPPSPMIRPDIRTLWRPVGRNELAKDRAGRLPGVPTSIA